MKILVIPDVHGREFWKIGAENIDKYDKIIFLGDYLDPYGFEGIDEEEAILNFIEILMFAGKNPEKVVLLLGNHDMGYYSEASYLTHTYGCRHSEYFHDDISRIFGDNPDIFKIAHYEDGVLFTHAGVTPQWLRNITESDLTPEQICDKLNSLLSKDLGDGSPLHMVSAYRGGDYISGSCIWADVHEMENLDSVDLGCRQVFGHTLQAFQDYDGNISYGAPIEGETWKMLDTACPYELDTETFKITKAE